MTHPSSDVPVAGSHDGPRTYHVGTISYSRAGLIMVFFWLLWGDFCFTLMESVVPSIIPLRLNDLEAPNWLIGLIVTTIPSALTFVINPIVSFKSDRHRGRWGRRIPFLAGATPFLVMFLVLLGYSEQIGRFLHAGILHGVSETTAILSVIGVLVVAFQFFNMFINSTFYYLFNDVVPPEFLGRFMALFRTVGTIAGALFNWFVISYANTHMTEIFVGAAILYFVAFMLMCWRVKEGTYPDPKPIEDERGPGIIASMRTYFRECFGHRIYWYFFIANAFYGMTWAVGPYSPLLAKSIGVPLELYGKIAGVAGIVSACLLVPAGMLVDKLHPLRMLIGATALIVLTQPLWLYFILGDPDPERARILYIAFTAISVPVGVLYGASELPMYMRLLPKDRYGQYCSANAMFRAVVTMGSGIASGAMIDVIAHYTVNKDFAYRFVPIWVMICFTGSLVFLLLLHREWKKRGGYSGYVAP